MNFKGRGLLRQPREAGDDFQVHVRARRPHRRRQRQRRQGQDRRRRPHSVSGRKVDLNFFRKNRHFPSSAMESDWATEAYRILP